MWAPLKHKGSRGRARWRVRVQVLTGLFCHDQLVLRLPINHCFPLTHLHRRQPLITRGCRGNLGFIMRKHHQEKLHRGHMWWVLWVTSSVVLSKVDSLHTFDTLWEARSFFMRWLVKRWAWTGINEGSSWSEVRDWSLSSCSGIGAVSEELPRRLSSGTCERRINEWRD